MAASVVKSVGRLLPSTSALFVCDIQERFRGAISGFPAVVETSQRMIRAANILDVPVLVTEHYPKALGNTVAELKEVMKPDVAVFNKLLFSMYTPEVQNWLKERPNIKQIILVGIETHVCVLQTTLDLLSDGYEVHLIVDGVSSIKPFDRAAGLGRLGQVGTMLVSSEAVIFQLTKTAQNPRFKEISALVKVAPQHSIPTSSL
uniref:Isochorismatase-like domain-containing protein n=1 Tax=Polytomella parva TaxID=51329 RepID=A0A7S0V9V2_9CHLO|mmetsp:Transcript_31162/g.56584  ORF Transcript_31162/g.56584 Transcript_31162/m.56584 type:complete len:203 (+) Transcript_31162:66-674(+)|eukprot:CAMPEP_0175063024 /NCGR_PEP_ID=MMETSP0052_2-20121109/14509_1 /TAXON_ID=51329 ORGANISM="Polytomella parva, Strain SAG 63-3" /NCGR_SAMPLE_ID=MMETSP0052_2 /ASSEMBLY_ACC=CAM_ASM_000194 /LENGTH=202 /DNA_ID=CAMNT_0016329141 /DNA_START=53 /DNA_END=661 /DNA_ORIENTATION=+